MNLLKISDLKQEQIDEIFLMADQLKSGEYPLSLKGKSIVLFFPESSIRTRLSFEIGIKNLGGDCILFPPSTLDKRESLEDVIKYIENWADVVIVRHKDFDKVSEMGKYSTITVVNAMTSDNHPCEILSDLYTISRLRNDYRKLRYTFVGEHGNISNSWRVAAEVLDFHMNHVCTLGNAIKGNDDHYTFTEDLEDVLSESDIVLTDPLSKNMKNEDYINKYQIALDRMKKTQDGAILNPCPPFFRGEEVSCDAIDSEYFVGHEFKKNLIYVQQAIILYCLGNNQ